MPQRKLAFWPYRSDPETPISLRVWGVYTFSGRIPPLLGMPVPLELSDPTLIYPFFNGPSFSIWAAAAAFWKFSQVKDPLPAPPSAQDVLGILFCGLVIEPIFGRPPPPSAAVWHPRKHFPSLYEGIPIPESIPPFLFSMESFFPPIRVRNAKRGEKSIFLPFLLTFSALRDFRTALEGERTRNAKRGKKLCLSFLLLWRSLSILEGERELPLRSPNY